jgi:hypothetical protein
MPTTLLTGLPRSGTTLTCALLNDYPDTLALAEPIQLEKHGDRARAVEEIEQFIATARQSVLTRNRVLTKHVDGHLPDNMVQPPSEATGLRRVLETRGEIAVDKTLSADFSLIVKHPAEFSALADLLIARHPLVALVRHPLAVLAAWQTVDMPVHRGHMPMMEAFAPRLAAKLETIPDRLKRQIALMDFLLRTYAEFPPAQVMRYEDVVANPAGELARLTPHAPGVPRSPRALAPHDPFSRYSAVDFAMIARELWAVRHIAERFYPDFSETLGRVGGAPKIHAVGPV